MFANPRHCGLPLAGMALFWAADAFAAWAGMATFGFRMNAASLFVGFATGMVFTPPHRAARRGGRTGLVPAANHLVQRGAARGGRCGVFAYRVLALWLPMPASLALLPTLRKMGEHRVPEAEGKAKPPEEPGLRRSALPARGVQ